MYEIVITHNGSRYYARDRYNLDRAIALSEHLKDYYHGDSFAVLDAFTGEVVFEI